MLEVAALAGHILLESGAGIYWTAYYLVTNEQALAGEKGFLTLKLAAIVLGILLVFKLSQKRFAPFSAGEKRRKKES